MKFLVLGGAGYVGSHFVYEALRQGHECSVYDNLSRGHRQAVPVAARFVKGDIRDQAALTDELRLFQPDVVLHYAAFALVGESVAQPELYADVNVRGTQTVLAALKACGRPVPLVFSSTCAVYGYPEVLPIAEDFAKRPVSPYGETKLRCEQLIEEWCQGGRAAAVLRYFNACGADLSGDIGEDHTCETHLIPNVIKAALADKEMVIFGDDFPTRDGTCIRDYVHVIDLAKAHIEAAQQLVSSRLQGFTALNLGTGKGYSNLEILQAIEKACGHSIRYRIGERRAGDPPELYADNKAARRVLGFAPKYSDLETVVKTALHWHKQYPQGFHTESF